MEHILNLLLYLLESHKGARFAFQVIKQSSYSNKLLPTLRVRTMI